MSTSTLSQFERGAINQLLKDGYSQNSIAKKINRSKSTISYELHRMKQYDPVLAQDDADYKRTKCGRKISINAEYARIISNHLHLTWSPEQIALHFKLCTKSIYNWIDRGILNFSSGLLPDKARRRKRKNETRGTFKINSTIEHRTNDINKRNEFGHWEVDTVLSSRGQSKQCLATFVERRSRFIWAIKIPDRSSNSMNRVFSTFMNQFSSTVKSVTVDHGKEFSGYQELNIKYNLPVYFCHPYSPWERGTNEYFNRKLRWFFPKKTNFNFVSEDEVFEALELINNRPLKILNGNTAISTFRKYFDGCSD